jgi:hypothetical protein
LLNTHPAYNTAAAFNVCTENCGELTLKTFICHKAPLDIKVLNCGTLSVDYSKERIKSDGKSDSILEMQHRFRTGGDGN